MRLSWPPRPEVLRPATIGFVGSWQGIRQRPEQQPRESAGEHVVVCDRFVTGLLEPWVVQRAQQQREVVRGRLVRQYATDPAAPFELPEAARRATDLDAVEKSRFLQADREQHRARTIRAH